MTRLFVYGTLMEGEPNHRYLARAQFVEAARTAAEFTLIDLGGYPGLVAAGATSVEGEIYEVDEEALAAIDLLEGHPTHYRRCSVGILGGSPADAYVLPHYRAAGRPVIDGGDWRGRCGSR